MRSGPPEAAPRVLGPVALFAICTAIWGSTWLAIKSQLGVVAPEVSVVWRFALAAAVIAAFCMMTRRSLRFPWRDHVLFVAQGVFFFGVNYVAIYWSELFLTSGLVAVLFSTITFTSLIGMRLAFGTPITLPALGGAALGVTGVTLLFLPEIVAARGGGAVAVGIGLALGGTLLATLGNLVSVLMHRQGLPIFPSTAWGMAYGTLVSAAIAVVTGAEWAFDPRPAYVLSLAYLALFGSVAAFGAYLTLLKQVGAGPSSYVAVTTPVVALLLSTALEGYRWTGVAVLGVVLAAAGNVLALHGKYRQT